MLYMFEKRYRVIWTDGRSLLRDSPPRSNGQVTSQTSSVSVALVSVPLFSGASFASTATARLHPVILAIRSWSEIECDPVRASLGAGR